jgi:hypothetical protein
VSGKGLSEPGPPTDPTCPPKSLPTVDIPTDAPGEEGTLEPSKLVDGQGTPPSEHHSYAPTDLVAGAGDGDCKDAWVYCPGRSTCFNDIGFNGGVPAEGKWGWSIVFDPSVDELVADCDILIGAPDCDLNTATKVGSFQMQNNFGHYCMANFGHAVQSFALYAGTCDGNDSGAYATSGQCSATDVATYAGSPTHFPLYRMNENNEINFTMDSTDPINTASSGWPATHQLFPISTKTYVSAYACVVPDPDNTFTGKEGSGVWWNWQGKY